MAHVEKRGAGRWRARYRGPDGQERSRTFPRRVDAERWLTGVEHSKLTGGYIDPNAGKITLRAFAEEWRSRQVQRAGTAVSIEQQLRLHVYPVIGDRPIAAIRPSEIQGLVQRLDERLAPSTVGVVYGRVVAVFRGAVRDRVVTASPCIDVRLPVKKPPSMLEVLSTEEVLVMADAVPARYGALVITGAGTGLRPGELFGLALERVDFLRRTIRVDQQLMRVRGQGVALGPLKTPSSYRTIPLPQVVAHAMAAHLAAWPVHPDLGVVFTNERAEPIQQQPFAAVWETGGGSQDCRSGRHRTTYATTSPASSSGRERRSRLSKPGSGTLRPRRPWTSTASVRRRGRQDADRHRPRTWRSRGLPAA